MDEHDADGAAAFFADDAVSGMAKLIYVANVSLDGCIEDTLGGFEWTEPTDEVFAFIN